VGEQPDDQAALVDHGLDLVGEAVFAGVFVELFLQRRELFLFDRRLRRVRLLDVQGFDRRVRFFFGRFGAPVGDDRAAAAEDVGAERLLQRLFQSLEFGDVDGRDREEHDEERQQQRDHVGVGEEPALGAAAALLAAVVAAPRLLAAPSVGGGTHQAAAFSGSAFGAAALGGAPAALSAAVLRSSGGTKASSLSATTRGLSPAWIASRPSIVSSRSEVSASAMWCSFEAAGRKIPLAEPTP